MNQIRPSAATGPRMTEAKGMNTMAKPKPVKPRTSPPIKVAASRTAIPSTVRPGMKEDSVKDMKPA